MITAMPEIQEQELQEDDEFLILACDGIWENLTSQQVHLSESLSSRGVTQCEPPITAASSGQPASALCEPILLQHPSKSADQTRHHCRTTTESPTNEGCSCPR